MNVFVRIGITATLGLLLQLVVALFLAATFLAARGRRSTPVWITFWNAAWALQAAAIAPLVLRFALLPNLNVQHLRDTSAGAAVFDGGYAAAKTLFWAAIACGCATFQRPAIRAGALRFLVGAALVYAAIVSVMGLSTDDVSVAMSFVGIVVSVCGAVGTVDVAPARRPRAAVALALTFAANAAVATAIVATRRMQAGPEGTWIVNYNSYLDCVLHLAMGACMLRLRSVSADPTGGSVARTGIERDGAATT